MTIPGASFAPSNIIAPIFEDTYVPLCLNGDETAVLKRLCCMASRSYLTFKTCNAGKIECKKSS